ncbi:cyclin-dependent protein kinase-activating kinase CAK1 [Ascoidea rubescens DSM 1968]|uniref:Kinase-like protein n=1 Tax=Ascoidea rubescens DSM 1968 TaxID=1344418 RepID=A0A1D2VCU6_9ASCO|nr:kinase-like protein [Ascoidea rubescens DSM 1968]ODV59451.1 kinase-like protein [Ascoidea rubescens DSM 1968]
MELITTDNDELLVEHYNNPVEELLTLVFPFYQYSLHDLVLQNSTHEKVRRRAKTSLRHRIDFLNLDLKSLQNYSRLKYRTITKNNLSLKQIFKILQGILNGLVFLHEHGIIHRDIKPENILFASLDPLDPNNDAKLIDFGISWIPPDNLSSIETPNSKYCDICTGIYKPPEVLLSARNYSTAIDIWGLAIILTFLFSLDSQAILSSPKLNKLSLQNNNNQLINLDSNDDDTDDDDNDQYDQINGYKTISDLNLLSNIFKAFGTPTIDDWPEMKSSSVFKFLNFEKNKRLPINILLPKLSIDNNNNNNNNNIFTSFEKLFHQMTIYESKDRVNALDLYNLVSETDNQL